jgi:hypothetical protein
MCNRPLKKLPELLEGRFAGFDVLSATLLLPDHAFIERHLTIVRFIMEIVQD